MLETKRRVIGQLVVCTGCCCGATEKGRSEVPVEWLKDEWRRRGLLKRFQLSISGCLGPCDLPNVIAINSGSGSQWLAEIKEFNQYRSLVEWLRDQLMQADCSIFQGNSINTGFTPGVERFSATFNGLDQKPPTELSANPSKLWARPIF